MELEVVQRRVVTSAAAGLLLLVVWILIGGCGVASEAGLEPAVQQSIRRADEHLKRGRLEQAGRELKRATALTRHKTYVYLTAVQMMFGDRSRRGPLRAKQALSFTRELLDLNDRGKLERKLTRDELTLALEALADLCNQLRRNDEAIPRLERAMKAWPEDARLANDLGYTYAEAGVKLDRALDLTQRAVRAEPDNGMFVDSLGWAYYKLGRCSEAIRQLRRAVRLAPAEPELRLHLSQAYLRAGRRIEAEIELTKAKACEAR